MLRLSVPCTVDASPRDALSLSWLPLRWKRSHLLRSKGSAFEGPSSWMPTLRFRSPVARTLGVTIRLTLVDHQVVESWEFDCTVQTERGEEYEGNQKVHLSKTGFWSSLMPGQFVSCYLVATVHDVAAPQVSLF